MNWHEENIRLTKELISKKSYSGKEKDVIDCLRNFFENSGFDEVIIDKYGSCIGGIVGKRDDGKNITTLFDGHVDTVVVNEEKWSFPPFVATEHNGRIYGRGSSDMKGALSSMAVATLKFAKETDKDFSGKIYVSGSVFEEVFEGVAPRSVSEIVNPDFVIIGEASELNLKIGQRGRAEIVVETFGVSAHSANPEKGVNAVLLMNDVIREIENIVPNEQEKLGKGILVLTDIISSPYPGSSVIPSSCRATYDRRLLVGETPESVLEPIQNVLSKLKEEKGIEAKVSLAEDSKLCYTGEEISSSRFFPGWLYDENEKLIQKAYNGLKNSGLDPEITNYSFCTNGSHYAGEKGILTIGFGPSHESLAHIDDEYVEIEQLKKAFDGYYEILREIYK
ncbi:YgeY family selenium metabolism-linked hydrolase [Miniphocaeibacter massiliensis]|uniref:YgeY family selenium metabolism-linked hydrolase n=1 Tax=Miniphocaeibacter massiliensis TaxID=2041841 RepID=UPI000C1BEF32|nr:YgeY family selenium metabolism-linked hydrolase [Miniphocaeibacter massiliensis]